MKKLYLALLITVFFGFTVNSVFAATNVLVNPGFESGLNDWEDLWGKPADLTKTVVHSGTFAVTKNVNSVADHAYWSQLYQDAAVSTGESIYASVYIRTSFAVAATARAGLMLQFLDSSDNVVGSSLKGRDIGGQSNWTLVEASSSAVPAGATKVRISVYVWAAQNDSLSLSGAAYYDDLFLSKEGRQPAVQTALLNTGFENGMTDWLELYGYPSSISANVVHSGNYAVSKTVQSVSEQDYWSQIYQVMKCRPLRGIRASLYVKTEFDMLSKAKAGLLIECLDSNGNVIRKYSSKIGGKTDWRKLNVIVYITPLRTAKVRFGGYIYAPMGNDISVGGKAYFDDASFMIR